MSQIKTNGITLECDTFGEVSNPPLIRVMRPGEQNIYP